MFNCVSADSHTLTTACAPKQPPQQPSPENKRRPAAGFIPKAVEEDPAVYQRVEDTWN